MPASQFVPNGGSDAQKTSLGRANAAKFIERLCQYPGSPDVIKEAQKHILKAHADRLTLELRSSRREEAHSSRQGNRSLVTSAATPAWVAEYRFQGDTVTVEDIVAGRAPRAKVLDMFAGGGAIPLEALRLGCEAYALDLNPVAHIIQLCTLVYPQKFGKPDPNAKGSAKDGTWAGLAAEVEHWGKWVLEKVKAEIGDLYPPIPDPEFQPRTDLSAGQAGANGRESFEEPQHVMGFAEDEQLRQPSNPKSEIRNPKSKGFLTPVAYLWTRTVRCKNPACGATVPLVKQTWLCKKKGRFAAMRMVAPKGEKRVRFEIVEARTEAALGFDPEGFSKRGNAACPFCGTVADIDYVKAEGCAGRMGQQMMTLICTNLGKQGKAYLSANDHPSAVPNESEIQQRISQLCASAGITKPAEPMPPYGTLGFRVQPYGVKSWGDLFTPRQMLCALTFSAAIRNATEQMLLKGVSNEATIAIGSYLALVIDRLVDWNSSLCSWSPESTGGAKIGHTFGRHALPMVWDFAESGVWGEATGSIDLCLEWVLLGLVEAQVSSQIPIVERGSATALPWSSGLFDAIITDPPYYDNVPYADISDFFYVWLKRMVGGLYPQHFATETTPKKNEAIAEPIRHGGNKAKAREAYENMMVQSFAEANRVLKSGGQMMVVYAHKTTLGWTTLVDALRRTGFVVTEAWPLDTEMKARLRALDSAALASSIFLVARKRDGAKTAEHVDRLLEDIRNQLLPLEAEFEETTEYGDKYRIRGTLTGPNRRALRVVSVWMTEGVTGNDEVYYPVSGEGKLIWLTNCSPKWR